MKKGLLCFVILAISGAAYFGVNAMTSKSDASLFLQNVEAMAQDENNTGETGPTKVRDCPTIYLYEYKVCMNTISIPCTPSNCYKVD